MRFCIGDFVIADWDYLVVVGCLIVATGLWLLWGLGAALLAIGMALILIGVGGAMRA